MSHLLGNAYSESQCKGKAIITLLTHSRDGGSADFWIRFDHLQELPYAFDPTIRILRVCYLAIANDVINDLHVGKCEWLPPYLR